MARAEQITPEQTHTLILEIEVPGFYVDGATQEAADEWYDGQVLPIVTEVH